jgi:hypothetical protein
MDSWLRAIMEFYPSGVRDITDLIEDWKTAGQKRFKKRTFFSS